MDEILFDHKNTYTLHIIYSCMYAVTNVETLLNFQFICDRSRVRFPAPQDFLNDDGSGTGSTQPHEDK
jgi:hypothetical protein